jgi:hypothetical protein
VINQIRGFLIERGNIVRPRRSTVPTENHIRVTWPGILA